MARLEHLPLESVVDLGDADLGPTPVAPGRRAERIWRFEQPEHPALASGQCAGCEGLHVPERDVLDQILARVQRGQRTPPPCTCDCCTLYLAI